MKVDEEVNYCCNHISSCVYNTIKYIFMFVIEVVSLTLTLEKIETKVMSLSLTLEDE